LNECTVAAAGTKHIERFASRFLTPPGYNHRRSLFTKGDGRAILISVGNTVARRRNLSRRFWFR
jgi:hypothetical protein